MNLSIAAQIESLLLYEGEALSLQSIAKTLDISKADAESGITELKNHLENRGVVLIENGTTYILATHPEMQPVFEKLRKDELERELSKAALETLTVIAYRGPIQKHDIDYIRGVNSHFSLRNLLVRGLIEKNEEKGNTFYILSTDTLSFLGIQNTESLPDWNHVSEEFIKIIARQTGDSTQQSPAH